MEYKYQCAKCGHKYLAYHEQCLKCDGFLIDNIQSEPPKDNPKEREV